MKASIISSFVSKVSVVLFLASGIHSSCVAVETLESKYLAENPEHVKYGGFTEDKYLAQIKNTALSGNAELAKVPIYLKEDLLGVDKKTPVPMQCGVYNGTLYVLVDKKVWEEFNEGKWLGNPVEKSEGGVNAIFFAKLINP